MLVKYWFLFYTFVLMVIYDSEAKYIQSATDLCDKITKIDAVIEALETSVLESAAKDSIEEYWLDDGQTKIRTIYKGTEAVVSSINAMIKLRNLYENKLNGRQFRLVDGKSLRI